MKIKLFGIGKKDPVEAPSVVQTIGRSFISPLARYTSCSRTEEYDLYRRLRKSIPVIDAAIDKLVLLMGDFKIRCDDCNVEYDINRFFENVRCSGENGFYRFGRAYMEQLLTFGTAAGEIVLTKDGRDIYSLVNVPLDTIRLCFDENEIDTLMCPSELFGVGEPFEHQELLLFSVLDPEPGNAEGKSVLSSLQFVSEILTDIYSTIDSSWKNAGNVRFAVTYKPNGDADRTLSRQRVQDIADEWSKVMRDDSTVSDFVSVGDISVKVIGADDRVLDSNIPVRQMLEQIASGLSLPASLLGLSQGENQMSRQQAELLELQIEHYRRIFNGAILKLANVWQELHGCAEELYVEWSSLDLKDRSDNEQRKETYDQ